MNRVITAIESGRCVLGVSQSLLRDPEVMLELSRRAALPAMALSGSPVAPVGSVNEAALARAVAQPGGVIVLIEPETADNPGIQELGRILGRAAHKPTVLVVARSYNPLQFALALRGVPVAHFKERGKVFLKALPMPPQATEESAPAAAKAKASTSPDAPVFQFVDREAELAQLGELLGAGGPIVVSGPAGVGRAWLTEHAVAASGLQRLPDLVIGWGTGADALFARIAEITRRGGSDLLSKRLTQAHTPVEATQAAIEALQAAQGTEGQVMVVRELHHALGREGDFFRKGRLEMLLEALLTHTYPLRLVFLSERQPVFYREGAARSLRRLEVGGVKGRSLHEIFEAYKAPEFPRDKFGPIHEKIHGHCLAARTYAIALRSREKGLDLLDDPKFLRMEDLRDVEPLQKYVRKQVDKVTGPEREALARLAHVRVPMTGALVNDLGVGRKGRLELLSKGLLDMIGTAEDRKYLVHPMVRMSLSLREVSDFDTFGKLAEIYARHSRDAEGIERLALAQEANRCATGARAFDKLIDVSFPDQDAVCESVYGLIRGQKPNFQLAHQRVAEILRRDPSSSEGWLLQAELLDRSGAKPEEVGQAYEDAIVRAPVPEVFHQAVSWMMGRRLRAKAIAALEAGIAALPNESRLRTRLAVLLLRDGRPNEALDHLRAAMELDPMLPDAYGIMGMVKKEEGAAAFDEAETLMREAVRLAPGDPVQGSRLAELLMLKARRDPSDAEKLQAEAHEILDAIVRGDRKAPEATLLLAQLIREQGGDLERAAWLLKQVKKATDRHHERNARIAFEFAMLDLHGGELDAAETTLRALAGKDPTNHRLFAALAQVLEARQLLIPAHAEYMRAKERTPQVSADLGLYEAELERLQGLIEAQAASLFAAPESQLGVPLAGPSSATHQRVIRRRKGDDEAPEGEAAAAEPEAAAESEAAPEAAAEPEAAADVDEPATDEAEPATDEAPRPSEATQDAGNEPEDDDIEAPTQPE